MTFLYLGAILMSLPAGWITDRLGVKKTIVYSLLFSGFFVALLGLTGSYLAAIFFTFIVGLGYGMANPPTTQGIMALASDANRGLAMSAKQTGVPIAGGSPPPRCLLWRFSPPGNLLLLWQGRGFFSPEFFPRFFTAPPERKIRLRAPSP